MTIEGARGLWQEAVGADENEEMSIKSEKNAQTFKSTTSSQVPSRSIGKLGKAQPGSHDLELVKVIGQGGMGAIFSACQTSMERRIAVKMILPDQARNEQTKAKFISEALVTGGLDHPNIVPVHELGQTAAGTLFYAMKEVKGTSWKDVISEKTESENLQILMDVCDAIAFAHDNGFIHRDLKPENIMLGDYGEVLVMDWGLAVCTEEGGKAEPVTDRMSKAGTPAYMAPEMATCEGSRLGPWSDIYLLGGILYEIVTGLKPHSGKGGIYACIYQAMENIIQKTNTEGELVDIALKAMATDPRDRYATVKDLQAAIREYQSHLESIVLSEKATRDLSEAQKKGDYDICAQALLGFRQALELWEENRVARYGVSKAQLAYAECALEREDFDLAVSLLDRKQRTHRKSLEQADRGLAKRKARNKHLRILTYAAIAAMVLIFVGKIFIFRGQLFVPEDVAVLQDDLKHVKRRIETIRISASARELSMRRQLHKLWQSASTSSGNSKMINSCQQAFRKNMDASSYAAVCSHVQGKLQARQYDAARALLINLTVPRFRHWEFGRLLYLCNKHGKAGSLYIRPPTPLSATDARSSSQAHGVLAADGRTAFFVQPGRIVITDLSTHAQKILPFKSDCRIKEVMSSGNGKTLLVFYHPQAASLTRGQTPFAARVDTVSGRQESVEIPSGHLHSFSISDNGKRIVFATSDRSGKISTLLFHIYDGGRPLLTQRLRITAGTYAKAIAIGHEGKKAAMLLLDQHSTTRQNELINIYSIESGKRLLSIRARRMESIKLVPCSTMLFLRGEKNQVSGLLDIITGKFIIFEDTGSLGAINLGASRDGQRLALISYRSLDVWDAASGARLLSCPFGERRGRSKHAVCFTADGMSVIIVWSDGSIQILPAEDWRKSGDLLSN